MTGGNKQLYAGISFVVRNKHFVGETDFYAYLSGCWTISALWLCDDSDLHITVSKLLIFIKVTQSNQSQFF